MSRTSSDPLKTSLWIPVVVSAGALITFAFQTWTSMEASSIRRQVVLTSRSLERSNEVRYQLLSEELSSTKPSSDNRSYIQILKEGQVLMNDVKTLPGMQKLAETGQHALSQFGDKHTGSTVLTLSSAFSRIKAELSPLHQNLISQLDYLDQMEMIAAGMKMCLLGWMVIFSIKKLKEESSTLTIVDEGLQSVYAGKSLSASGSAPPELARSFAKLSSMVSEIRRNEQAVINNALDVICTVDENNRFAMINPSSLRVLGYKPEELIGHKIQEFIADGNDNDQIGMLVGTSKSMAKVSVETQWRKKDGSLVSLLWSAYWSSGSETLFCVVHDITDRKIAEQILRESESRLRAILEGMPVAVLVENQGLIEYSNRHAMTLSGYGENELHGENLLLLTPHGSKTVQACLDNKMEGAEISVIRKNGEIFTAELYSAALGRTGDDKRRLVMLVDMTERHRMEQLKREFLAMAGHELRTPLTSVRVTLQSVADGVYGKISERGVDLLGRCDGELVRLVALISEMLDAERIRSGKLQLAVKRAHVPTLIEAAVSAVKPVALARDIQIVAKSDDFDLVIDGAKVIQVIINLISNAVKFSPSHSQILIRAQTLSDKARIEVEDKGRGIPPGYENLIFEQFSQVERNDSNRGRGAGLGLSICKSIVEAHGGLIGVDSKYGEGSVFWVELPCLAQTDD
ncbi:MAG: PAS domain-containing sensor histidine kinase [Candidatus Obscuribacterales bacterium]|nr:PAS domain-containing sensor histidine kinase [Candidatus Obscuribacterales bacterium]